jgi:hypothetical protein
MCLRGGPPRGSAVGARVAVCVAVYTMMRLQLAYIIILHAPPQLQSYARICFCVRLFNFRRGALLAQYVRNVSVCGSVVSELNVPPQATVERCRR